MSWYACFLLYLSLGDRMYHPEENKLNFRHMGMKEIKMKDVKTIPKHRIDRHEFNTGNLGYYKTAQTDYYTVWRVSEYDDIQHRLIRHGYEVWTPTAHYKCVTSAEKDIMIQKILGNYLSEIHFLPPNFDSNEL